MRCIESLLTSTYEKHSIVVVDNGSGNDDADRIEDRFGGRIELIRAPRNLGYGGGANLGILWALGQHVDYVWILNNDTVITVDAIGRLVAAMETDRGLGASSPLIDAPIGPESPEGIWYSGGTVNLARAETHHLRTSPGPTPGVIPTGYITGCAMFLRSEALQASGLFWESLFLYWEDVDLSLRLRRAGWGLGVVPSATISHLVHGSVRPDVAERFYSRNAILVARRHESTRVVVRALMSLLTRLVRHWASALLRRRSMPIAETRGLAEGAAAAFWWTARRGINLGTDRKSSSAGPFTGEGAPSPREAR